MRSRTLALLLAALPALAAAAARVEVAPEALSPAPTAAPVSAPAPLALVPTAPALPLAAPLAAPAPAPALAAPAAPASTPRAQAAVPVAAAPAARRALRQTLAAPVPEFATMGGAESSAAAERDFAARAQLGGGEAGSGVSAAPSLPDAAPRASGLERAAPARRGGAGPLVPSFAPGGRGLEPLARADGVLLYRARSDGRWRLARVGADGFAAAPEDFDAAVLGRASGPAYPTAEDLRASAGRAARFAIASPGGVVEWSADVPADAPELIDGSPGRRALARAASALGLYPRLLAACGVAAERRSFARADRAWLEEGRAPRAERQMEGTIVPAWIRAELPVAAARLGRPLDAGYEREVLAESKVWVYRWHSRWTYEVSGGLPDGHYDPRFGVRVMLKTDWRRLKDPESHFRVLWAHEYTHRLQHEGLVTNRYGIEIPPVAVEQLRAVELVGLAGMKAGRIGFIAENNLQAFESGRAWVRDGMRDETSLYYRGVLGGAAYEVGLIAGRPEAAWEFLNLVIAQKGGLKVREAYRRVVGRDP